MSGIKVYVLPPTEAGRLYPYYDKEVDVLVVCSHFARPWPFGFDIDTDVIFDLDEWRVLANIDMRIPRREWKTEGFGADAPMIAPPGDLAFTPETVEARSFSLPLAVRTDVQTGRVSIRFSTLRPDRVVSLSPVCIAFLRQDELLGFDVRDVEER